MVLRASINSWLQ